PLGHRDRRRHCGRVRTHHDRCRCRGPYRRSSNRGARMSDIELLTRRHSLTASRHTGTVLAGAIAAVLVLCAVAPGLMAPADPLAVNPHDSFAAPSIAHLFGPDESGRDVLSRVIFGARDSLTIGAAATGIGLIGGTVLGIIGGLL